MPKQVTDRLPVTLTRAPLAANASYTSPAWDRLLNEHYPTRIRLEVWADQSGTLYLEERDNPSGAWSTTASVAVTANSTKEIAWTQLTKRQYRVRYANDGTAQTEFYLLMETGGGAVELGDVDIAIGAVEVKDADSDTRAQVTAGNAAEADAGLVVKTAAVGARDDTAATTDTGTFSLIALFKRFLDRLTSGDWKIIIRGGAKGSTTAADVTSKAVDANTQALHVSQAEALPAGSNRIGKVTVRNSADNADIDPLAETTFTDRLGATNDAAQTDATQTAGAIPWLKGIVKVLADAWDDTKNALRVLLPNLSATAAQAGQTTTDAYAEVSGTKIDTAGYGQKSVMYRLAETGAVNGITYKVQGSVDDTNWDDLTTLDEAGTERAGVEIALSAGTSANAIITPHYDSGAKAAYRYYRVMVKSTTAGNSGSAAVSGFAK